MKIKAALVALALAAATLAAFWPATGHGFFLEYDDNLYVAANPAVREGLTPAAVCWAFTNVGYASNWHPLTWLSLMLDVSLFGPSPQRLHLMNILMHAATAVLLLALWRRLTGSLWAAAFVASLFALHPLRVESVAWIAERKDVLGGACFALALLAHAAYARRPSPLRRALVAVALALALLAKPMSVTLPFVLLLLDYWPLGRFPLPAAGAAADAPGDRRRRAARLFTEKLPLFLICAAAAAVTVSAQRSEGYLLSLESLSLVERLGNAVLGYVRYLGKILWPSELIFFYPHRAGAQPTAKVVAAALALAAATVIILRAAGRRPSLAVGWLWFLGTLVPVIGIVQVGWQSIADRYTYLPGIGVSVMAAGAISALRLPQLAAGHGPRRAPSRPLLAAGALVVAAILAFMTRRQVDYWRDSATLFARTLEVDADNWVIQNDFGTALLLQGRPAEALPHLEAAFALKPDFTDNRLNLGVALERLGRPSAAEHHYREVLRASPGMTKAWFNLASLLVAQRRLDEGAAAYREGLRLQPGHAAASTNYGLVLEALGRVPEAQAQLRETVRRAPGFAPGWYNLGRVSLSLGEPSEALLAFEEVLRLDPGNVPAARFAASLRARQGGGPRLP